MIEAWTSNVGREAVLSDQAIIAAYSAVSGYNPATGSGDTGTVALDVLNSWHKTGIGQHTIQADAALKSGNHAHIRATVYLFGGCYVGLALPKTAREHLVWSASPEGTTGNAAPNWWGGHAVPVVAYSPEGLTDGRDMGCAPADDLGLLGYLLR